MDAFWLYGISDIVVISNGALNELYAQYGMKNLGDALNAEGDLLTLMNLMQVEVETNVDLQNILINYGSQDVASAAITAGFLRTAEMGSSLSGAQSVLADQIGLRTREHLRSFRLAGKTGPSGARGPASWWDRSMNRLHDALPNFNLRDSMRSAQDRMPEPSFSDERASVKKPWISGVQGGAIPSFNSEITIPSHYQTWGRAYVADLDQESTGGFAGYDASVRGGVLGVDRRFDHAVVGVAGGMGKTIVTGADGHSGEADSLQSMAYASYFTDRVYLNAHISYARSDVETEGVSDFGYRSEYDANNLSFFVGAGVGYKMFNDAVLITPEVSLLSSKYSRDGYTSSSSMSQTLGFEDMVFDSYDQWSYQSELGVAVSSMKLIENTRLQLALQPEFRVHWVHEFEPDPDAERYQLSGSTQLLHAQLQSREENLIRLGGGVRCWNWNSQTTEFGLNLDHLKGDAYTEWMFSGHFVHRF
jgi:outer membrane autotransporter protein